MRLAVPLLALLAVACATEEATSTSAPATGAPTTQAPTTELKTEAPTTTVQETTSTTTMGQPEPIYKAKKTSAAEKVMKKKVAAAKAEAKRANDEAQATNRTANDAFGVPAPCPDGFVWGQNGACEDFNECWAHKYVCPTDANCINTKGSYLCDCGPRQEYRNGECRPVRENARNRDVCFLEYPLQFLEYGEGQDKAAAKIYPEQAYNPGAVPKGNTGIAACKESCRNDFRCEAAVVVRDDDNEKYNQCYHRLLRTDEGQAPVNSVLQNLKEDHDAVTFVKAKCGSCCEYPDTDIEGTPLLKVSASSAQDCCSTAGLVVGAVAAVYRPKDIAYDEKRNCRIYGWKPPAPAKGKGWGKGHQGKGWGGQAPAKGYEGPSDIMDDFFDKEGSTTLVPGPCRNAYKFYLDAGDDCCLSYKRNFFPSEPINRFVDKLGLGAEPKVDMQSMPVPIRTFPLHSARKQCCAYCKQHEDCTGAQLVEGRCELFMNDVTGSDFLSGVLVATFQNPGEFFQNGVQPAKGSGNDKKGGRRKRFASRSNGNKGGSPSIKDFVPDLPQEVEVLVRPQQSCDALACLYPFLEPRDDQPEENEGFDFRDAFENDDIGRRCWADCQTRKDCHAVEVRKPKKRSGRGRQADIECNFFDNKSPVGFQRQDLKESSETLASLFKPNPDWTCSPPLEPELEDDCRKGGCKKRGNGRGNGSRQSAVAQPAAQAAGAEAAPPVDPEVTTTTTAETPALDAAGDGK